MTPESRYLRTLAERIGATYGDVVLPRAILLTGSAALGESDRYSDLDLIFYHDSMPAEAIFKTAREGLGAERYSALSPWSENEFAEHFYLSGVECQLAHITIATWEEQLADVVDRFETSPPTQKAVGGLFDGYPLRGAELIAQWRSRADYPDGLARAMVQQNAQFPPIWSIREHLLKRDASVWITELLVQSAYQLFSVLAGFNRQYFSTFQFKRMHRFADELEIKPAHLAERVDLMVGGDRAAAIDELESLVAETLALLSHHMPDVELPALLRPPGHREPPWESPEERA
jgi:hypothetical protein